MRTLVVLLVSFLTAACSSGDSGAAADGSTGSAASSAGAAAEGRQASLEEVLDDPDVVPVYRAMMERIAPEDGWSRTRYLAFDWIVDRDDGRLVRSHRWDRRTGEYRVRAPVDGGEMVALFDVDAPTEGERVWVDGEPVDDAARSDSLATRAHAMFINDSYWLVMPFKWADPGVTTSYLGRMEQWGKEYDVVELTFEEVGLTPQNKYRGFVDPETGLFEIWQHFRQASDGEPAFTMAWTDWRRTGPIWLSPRRENQDGEARIYFENLEAATEAPEGAFTGPDAGAAGG